MKTRFTPARHQWAKVARLWSYPTEGTTADQRIGMRLIWWEGLLATASVAFRGEFVVMYMLALGASDTLIGLRTSINSVASLVAPLLGAYLVARTGKRKLLVMSGAGVLRSCILLCAFIPFFTHGDTAVYLFLGFVGIQSFAYSVLLPPWNSLIGDICPLPIRGRYLGSRMMFSNIATMTVIPVAGWILGRIGGLRGFQTLWIIAALFGFASIAVFSRVPEPQAAETSKRKGNNLRRALAVCIKDRRFIWFLSTSFVWTLGLFIAEPYYSVHMVQTLGFGAEKIALLGTIATIASVIALRGWGELVDRWGAPRVNAASMILLPIFPILWIPASSVAAVAMVRAFGAMAYGATIVASTPLILILAPDEHRAEYVALRVTVDGIAMIIGPILAARLYVTRGFTVNLVVSSGLFVISAIMFLSMIRKGMFKQPADSHDV